MRSEQLEPIYAGDNVAEQVEKNAKEDDAATDATARTPPAKTKVALQPIVDGAEQKELEQTGETSLTITHFKPPYRLTADHSFAVGGR